MTDVPSYDAATAATEPPRVTNACLTCPVCRLIVALRGEGTELSDVLAQTGRVLRQVLAIWLEDNLGGPAETSDSADTEASAGQSESSSPRVRVQRIPVD